MECPYCSAELVWNDYYGKTKYAEHYYLYPQSWIEKEGDIYKCPNHEGFEYLEEAKDYKDNNIDLKDVKIEEVCCISSDFNGFFYTDMNGNLQEGYPC